MKDSIMLALPAKDRGVGGEASAFGGCLVLSIVERTTVYERAIDDANAVEKLTPMANQIEQKEKLTMDPMVESLWRSKEFSTRAKEIVSLVGQCVDMPGTPSGGVVLQTTGVGQMKLEAPL